MLAAYTRGVSADDPLSALAVGERPEPVAEEGWTVVSVKAASLNHHDLWTLRGVGRVEPGVERILGSDAAGIDEDGRRVVVHAVVATAEWQGPELLNPHASLLSERHDGTLAPLLAVPRRHLLPIPSDLSFEDACCLPTAWLTAFRMLFSHSVVPPDGTILVQGAGGGVSTALIALGRAAGFRVWVTSRSEEKRAAALALGADRTFEPGAKLPERVSAVMETVGEATWAHSLRAVKAGGAIVLAGATSGSQPPADLSSIFLRQLRIFGTTMGSRHELEALIAFCARTGVRPAIEATYPLSAARDAFAALASGNGMGKIVIQP